MSEIAIPAIVVSALCTLFFCWRLIRWRGPRLWIFFLTLPALALCFWYPLLGLLGGLRPWTSILAYVGTTWMALAGAFTGIALLLELIRAFFRLYFKRSEGEARDILPPRRSVPLGLLLLLAFTAYAAYEARQIRVTRIAIQTDKLPEGVNDYRIVFVSDVHLNELTGEKFLARITGAIKEQRADLLLCGGDLLSLPDMRTRHKEAALLAGAMPPNGSLAVLGNHEALNGHLDNAIPFLRRAWFHVMRGEAVAVGGVYVVGVDDPKVAEVQGTAAHDPVTILSRIPHDRFVILLKHRPDVPPESVGLFDLQLSGHTHGGQIWPGRRLIELLFGTPQGRLTRLEGEKGSSWYYCTSGAGFSALPLRFLTPPEIVVVDLLR